MKANFILPCIAASVLFASCGEKAPPEITLDGGEEMTIYMGEDFTDPGATATDYKDRDISSDIMTLGSVGDDAGYYTIDYTVEDKKGNFSVVHRGVSRGFKNTDLEGIYEVVQTTNNGGGTETYMATITADGSDITSLTLDNSNSIYASVVMEASIINGALQVEIPDQTDGGYSIYNGDVGNSLSGGPSSAYQMQIDFQTTSSITYNHSATWTKQ